MRVRTLRVLSSSRLGYRGAILLCFALVDFVYSWFLINPTPEQRHTSDFVWRSTVMPAAAWGAIWVVAGLTLLATAFMRQDRIGYAVAIALKVAWAFVAVVGGINGHVQGAGRTVAIWGVFALIAIIESGRPEPVHTETVTVIDDEGRS